MVVERNYEGAWVIYSLVDSLGYMVTRRYYFMSKREAVASFKRELKALEVSNA